MAETTMEKRNAVLKYILARVVLFGFGDEVMRTIL